jgi:hypothetical protein
MLGTDHRPVAAVLALQHPPNSPVCSYGTTYNLWMPPYFNKFAGSRSKLTRRRNKFDVD